MQGAGFTQEINNNNKIKTKDYKVKNKNKGSFA